MIAGKLIRLVLCSCPDLSLLAVIWLLSWVLTRLLAQPAQPHVTTLALAYWLTQLLTLFVYTCVIHDVQGHAADRRGAGGSASKAF
jgi:hypothetical protein